MCLGFGFPNRLHNRVIDRFGFGFPNRLHDRVVDRLGFGFPNWTSHGVVHLTRVRLANIVYRRNGFFFTNRFTYRFVARVGLWFVHDTPSRFHDRVAAAVRPQRWLPRHNHKCCNLQRHSKQPLLNSPTTGRTKPQPSTLLSVSSSSHLPSCQHITGT